MSRPDPPTDTPQTPLIYGFESDGGDTCTFPLAQLRQSSSSAGRARLVEVAGLPGKLDLDGTQEGVQGPLEIEVAYLLTRSSGTALYAAQAEIERLTARPGKLWRIMPNGSCQWTRVRRLGTPRKVTAVENLATSAWQNVSMQFVAPAGYWHGENQESGTEVYYGVPLYGATTYGGDRAGFELSGTSTAGTIEMSGDAVCRALQLRLTAGAGGTIAAPTIAQPAFNQSLTYGGTITDTDYIELDTVVPSLTNGTAGTDVWSNLTLGAAHTQGLLWLEPGQNIITISSSGTMSGTAGFYYYPPFH